MADYSGHLDAWDTHFYPDQSRSQYWGSTKTFSTPKTTVPVEYLGYLCDLLQDHQRKTAHAEKATIRLHRGRYVLEGYALFESGRKVRERFGWENPCQHNNISNRLNGTYVCWNCNEEVSDG